MKTVTTMLVLVLSSACISVAYAQSSCLQECDKNEKQCMLKNTKSDWWGNRLVTPEGEKACLESSRECKKNCWKQSVPK